MLDGAQWIPNPLKDRPLRIVVGWYTVDITLLIIVSQIRCYMLNAWMCCLVISDQMLYVKCLCVLSRYLIRCYMLNVVCVVSLSQMLYVKCCVYVVSLSQIRCYMLNVVCVVSLSQIRCYMLNVVCVVSLSQIRCYMLNVVCMLSRYLRSDVIC